jgi:hypothetical protein
LGQHIEMGRFGLPEGSYGQVKVRLAEHPLAERKAGENDPGLEETIWIERLSPCHGIVRSALFQDLGVDYGDVVLFDGAPVTHHKYGEDHVVASADGVRVFAPDLSRILGDDARADVEARRAGMIGEG